jgi:hypothetical protein
VYSHLRKTEKLQDTARGAMYRMYSKKEYMQMSPPEEVLKNALFESARRFFLAKKKSAIGVAFKNSLTESIKPEWLLWAVAPTLNQVEHNQILVAARVKPVPPPWSS